jgi:hypothetical protein
MLLVSHTIRRGGIVVLVTSSNVTGFSTLTGSNLIPPVDAAVLVSGGKWKHTVPALTIEVLDIPPRR